MIRMRRLFLGRRGQSTLEYAVIIAVIGAGLVLLSAYVRRGYQGRLRAQADNLGEQFDPGVTESEYIVVSSPVTVSSEVSEEGDIRTERAGGGTDVTKDTTTTPWESE